MTTTEIRPTTDAGVTIYQSENGTVEVRLDRDTVWLTQRQMAEVFDTTPENVLMHLKNIYADQELPEAATAKDFLAVRTEGRRQVKRQLRHYNLDAIISVGYRVNSRRAVGFRQWATRTLSEHLTRGYTLNRQRLQANALELEAALQLVKKAAQSPELLADTGRGLVDIVTRYAGDLFRRFAGPNNSIQIYHLRADCIRCKEFVAQGQLSALRGSDAGSTPVSEEKVWNIESFKNVDRSGFLGKRSDF